MSKVTAPILMQHSLFDANILGEYLTKLVVSGLLAAITEERIATVIALHIS